MGHCCQNVTNFLNAKVERGGAPACSRLRPQTAPSRLQAGAPVWLRLGRAAPVALNCGCATFNIQHSKPKPMAVTINIGTRLLGSARASRAVFSALAEHTSGRNIFKTKRAHGAFESATRASLTAAGAAALPKIVQPLLCQYQHELLYSCVLWVFSSPVTRHDLCAGRER